VLRLNFSSSGYLTVSLMIAQLAAVDIFGGSVLLPW
jgi:hypothetical protein